MPSDTSFSRAGQPGAAPQPPEPVAEEPRTTETTLTTRIRINIPGSRPIPPVVVRSPIAGGESAEEQPEAREAAAPEPPARRRHRGDTFGSPVLGVMEGSNSTATPPDLPPEWQTGAPAAAAPAPAPAPEAEGAPESGSTWFAPRKKSRPGSTPAAAPAAQAPAPAPAPAPTYPEPQQQPSYQPEQTYETPLPPQAYEQQQPSFEQPQAYEQPQQPFEQPYEQQQPFEPGQPPSDHTMQLFLPPAPEAQQPFDERFEAQFAPQPYDPSANFPQQQGGAPAAGRRPAPAAGFNGGLTAAASATAQQPAQSPAPENAFEATAPIPVLPKPKGGQQQPGKQQGGKQQTPKQRGPKQQAAAQQRGPQERAAAAPSVPDGYAGGTGGAGAPPRKESGQEAAAPAAGASAKPAKKRGRGRKLVVTGIGALVLAAAVAYGAGLMLNQADVPRGTTVLGYGIGGDTRDTAVDTLNNTVGKIATAPMTLSVGGRSVSLNPTAAGLTIDTTATVASVAKKSYNPVTVVESLLGGVHAVDPVVVIDPDKLRYALQQLSTGSGTSHEGSVHFDADGKVVTVLPQAGQALDVDQAVNLVRQAYQARAQGAPSTTVVLPMTTTAPKVSAAAVQSAASTIGAWAVKQRFYVTVKGSSPVPFGQHTFSEALSLQPGPNGTLVPVFDLAKLENAYGPAFAGETVLHNGTAGPVTVQDVASALVQLISKPGGPTTITIQ